MNADYALQEIGAVERTPEPFHQTLFMHGLSLERGKTTILQINVGLLCNQSCRHCHLNAGPGRKENMDAKTADAVIAYARRSCFETIERWFPFHGTDICATATLIRPGDFTWASGRRMYPKWTAHPRQATLSLSLIIVTRAPQEQVLPEEAPSVPEFRPRGERKWMK